VGDGVWLDHECLAGMGMEGVWAGIFVHAAEIEQSEMNW